MVVSSTSMNVGTTTAAATNQGLIARRPTAGGANATLLMIVRSQRSEVRSQRPEIRGRLTSDFCALTCCQGFGSVGPFGSWANGCNLAPAFGPVGGSL